MLMLTVQIAEASQRARARDWRVAGDKAYGPQVQKYVVVTPRAGVAAAQLGRPHGGVVYPWQQTQLTAPAYPWGWFGARWNPQTTTHWGYYSDYKDTIFTRDY